MLISSDNRFQILANYIPDLICTVDPHSIMQYVSPSCEQILAWLPEELTGRSPEHFVLPEDLPALEEAQAQTFLMDKGGVPACARMRRKDGTFVWMEMTASIVRDPETAAVVEAVLVMRDISQRKAAEEKLCALALTDGLTGLANRRAFDDALERGWRRTLRDGSPLSLLLLDLDHFKEFNDLYGHQVGDDCLRAVAVVLADCLHRPGDLAARYGGEEMAAIVHGTDADGAIELAEQMRSGIEALCLPHEGNPEGGSRVTASIGVATALARHGGTMRMPESLLQAADIALYKAKHQGRNCIATSLLVAPREP